MYKMLTVCFLAFVITNWSQNVKATDEFYVEEKRLLELTQDQFEEENANSDECNSETCDDDCRLACCVNECSNINCLSECIGGQNKMAAADFEGLNEDENDARTGDSLTYRGFSYRKSERRSPFRQRTSHYRQKRSPFRGSWRSRRRHVDG